MYVDAFLLVSDNQAVVATAFSTHTIDLGASVPKRDIGSGEPIGFAVNIDVAADFTTGDETYTVEVVQSDNANLATPDVLSSKLLTAAERAVGSLIFIGVNAGAPTKRYLGLRYTVAGTTPSATVSAWLTPAKLFSLMTTYYARNYSV